VNLFIAESEILEKVKILADKISDDYANKEVVLLGVLKGSFPFLSDLGKALTIPVKVDFIQVRSYRGTNTSGNVELIKQPDATLVKNKNVILVEDIVDTGLTLEFILDYVKKLHPSSVAVATLLYKKEKANIPPDYYAIEIADHFVVGYGMDLDEQYRTLRDIYTIDPVE